MSFLFGSMSIELYIIVFILVILASISEIYNMKKNKTGNPIIWVFPFLILTSVSFILKKCSMELTTNMVFQKVADISATICAVIFFIVFVITYIIAYKKGHITVEKLKKLKPLIIACLLIMIICTTYVLYYKFSH